jgi:ADP-heptose:LPS heptosyltransferase
MVAGAERYIRFFAWDDRVGKPVPERRQLTSLFPIGKLVLHRKTSNGESDTKSIQVNNVNNSTHQKRILLCNIGRIGDTLIRNSILDSARNTYGHIDYICGRPTAPINATDKRIDRLFIYQNTLRGFADLLRATVLQRHDCYLDLKDHDSSISLMIATICRARLKVGCNRKSYRPFHRDTTHAHGKLKKKIDVMRDIAAIAGLNPGDFRLQLGCSEASRGWFKKNHPQLDRFVFVNISATATTRIWPEHHWIEFLSNPLFAGTRKLISGLPAHSGSVDQIVAGTPDALPFRPRGLMDVIAAMECSQSVFTVDTGVVQVAAALHRSMVVLYTSKEQAHDFSPGGDENIFLSPTVNQQIATLLPDQAIAAVVGRKFAGFQHS